MDLDPQIAETIVTNLKGIINHEINLFDTTGTIIASTDRSRIGTSHDGARLVISTKQTISIDDDHEYKGAKHGINVPVIFNDSVVAVIGITGKREEVEPFGNVIRKMTEILIRENWEQITRFDQRERLTNLVDQLKLRHHDPGLANYLASVLEIDLTLPRRCVVGRLAATEGAACETTGEAAESPYATVYARFQQLRHSFFSLTGEEICMFLAEEDVRDPQKLLRGLQHDCEERLHLSLICGVGNTISSPDTYWQSYDEARKAADWLLFSRSGTLAHYDELDYGIFITAVPAEDAERFERHVFEGLSEQPIDEFQVIFDAYTRHNGSILHCSEELFLHKNTLQNRLNKMARVTGYNPRELADYAVLSVAFLLRRHLRFKRH